MKFKIFCLIVVLFSFANLTLATYDCNVYATQKYSLTSLVPNIANNLDWKGQMNFQNHTYVWKSNIPASTENMVLRFQFRRTGNFNKKTYLIFANGQPSDWFQLVLYKNNLTVQLQSFHYEKKTFIISNKLNLELTWFTFSFHNDRLDVYYDTKYLGTIYNTVSFDQFNGPLYNINQSKDDYNGDGPVEGIMTNLEIYTDIQTQPFIDRCIVKGRPIHIFCDYYLTYHNQLSQTQNNEDYSSYEIDSDDDEQLQYTQ